MRYLFLILVAYFVFKAMGKMLSNLKIMDTDPNKVQGSNDDHHHRLKVDESEIEDADFKDVE